MWGGLNLQVHAITRKGINKDKNEDSVFINNTILDNEYYTMSIDDTCILAAIADGVGGNNAGDVASNMVIEAIGILSKCEIINEHTIISLINEINNKVIIESNKNVQLSKMATTLSGIYIINDKAWIFHVGNTRIYTMQGSYLKQLTEDHTTVNWLIKKGVITEEEAETYSKRNEITNCIGGGNEKLLEAFYVSEVFEIIENSRKIIITSDGVHEYVGIDELEKIMSDALLGQEICENVVAEAIRNGSQDDISVILIMR